MNCGSLIERGMRNITGHRKVTVMKVMISLAKARLEQLEPMEIVQRYNTLVSQGCNANIQHFRRQP
jgi:hypothetical protein